MHTDHYGIKMNQDNIALSGPVINERSDESLSNRLTEVDQPNIHLTQNHSIDESDKIVVQPNKPA